MLIIIFRKGMDCMKQYTVKVYDNRTEWYNSDNKIHRDDGPAYVHSNGYKSWWKNGKRHRDDGPAVEYPNVVKRYFLEDIEYDEYEYFKKINSCSGKIIEVNGKKYTLVPM